MANEITIQIAMSRQHATVTADNHTFPPLRVQYTQTGTIHDDRIHSITTTESQITFPSIGTNGFVLMHNTDSTNYVEWDFHGTVNGGKMKAGEIAGPLRLKPGAELHMKANTATCKVRIIHYED